MGNVAAMWVREPWALGEQQLLQRRRRTRERQGGTIHSENATYNLCRVSLVLVVHKRGGDDALWWGRMKMPHITFGSYWWQTRGENYTLFLVEPKVKFQETSTHMYFIA